MLVLTIIIFLILSAFFSGSEIAFISASKLGIEVKKNKDSKKGNVLAGFYRKPNDFLGTMLVGNNIALVIFTYCMTELFNPILLGFMQEGPLLLFINTIISTIVVLMFGEFLPKTFFRLFSNEALFIFAYPLRFFKIILSPFTWVTNQFSNFILKYILRTQVVKEDVLLTRMDLEHYITDSFRKSSDDIDKEIFANALGLNQLKVRDCMIPRNEIVYVDKQLSMDELLAVFKTSGHSRILVIENDIENVVGYIHHGHLLQNPTSIDKIILELPFVPEVMNTRDLMLRFIRERTNIACVVDEFGGTAGVITLEDILEEIFGEIEDEHDVEEFVEEVINENEYLFSGRLEVSYLNEKFPDLNFPEGEYQTLSGFIVMTYGAIPKKSSEITIGQYKFILEKVSDTKIEVIKVIRQNRIDPNEIK